MKTILTLKIDHIIDIITNSSSELFVLQGENKETAIQFIKSIYPNYLDEYYELTSFRELDERELNVFLRYAFLYNNENPQTWNNRFGPTYLGADVPGFSRDEVYEEMKPDSEGRYPFCPKFKASFIDPSNRERINQSLDPHNSTYFMFSKDDNPDWDFQEKLMDAGLVRHHLG